MSRVTPGAVVMAGAAIVVAAAVAGGVWVMGSPVEQRLLRMDERRVQDLRHIATAVDMFSERHRRLPEGLDDLSKMPGIHVTVTDPETAEPYAYEITGDTTYRLCARFARETPGGDRTAEMSMRWPSRWGHGQGRSCFDLTAKRTEL